MIPLEQAAENYGVCVQTIRNWVNKQVITFSYIGNKLMIDEESLAQCIELRARISHCNEQLEEYARIKEKEVAYAIQGIEDFLFLIRSIKKVSPLFRFIVTEISLLIDDGFKREIFLEAMLSKNLSEVATNYNLSVKKVQSIYNETLDSLLAKSGFLINYHKMMLEKNREIRRLNLLNRNMKETLDRVLEQDPNLFCIKPLEYIPNEYVDILSRELRDMNLDIRIFNCLHILELRTVEDLLRYVKQNGFERLKSVRNFGDKSLAELKRVLIDNQIINANGDSFLFGFID